MSKPQLGKSRIVIVGGGAGGLELATRLGDKYGRKGKFEITLIERNRTHVWKPKLHEIAAGSMDISAHEVDYLAQSYWHGFRYRIGEMIGIDRDRRQVLVAPYLDTEGREVTPKRTFDYDVLVVAVGSQNNDFGTPGVVRSCDQAGIAAGCEAVPRTNGQCVHPRPCPIVALGNSSVEGRHHRCRRDRCRTCGRAPQNDAGSGGVWPRSGRSPEGHQDHADRGRRSGASRAARTGFERDGEVARQARGRTCWWAPRSPRSVPTV